MKRRTPSLFSYFYRYFFPQGKMSTGSSEEREQKERILYLRRVHDTVYLASRVLFRVDEYLPATIANRQNCHAGHLPAAGCVKILGSCFIENRSKLVLRISQN